jgi:hypothetical protein
MLVIAPAALATACDDDDVRLGEVKGPRSQPHFLMTIVVNAGRERTKATVSFEAPDTWEVRGPGTLEYPEHVVIVGDRGWERAGSVWRDFPRVKAMRETLLALVSTEDGFDSDLRSSGNGQRYQGEKTFRYVKTVPMLEPIPDEVYGHPLPPSMVATLTAQYKDATIKTETHVGAESKLIYFLGSVTHGPHGMVGFSWTFDYTTPVSITVPS